MCGESFPRTPLECNLSHLKMILASSNCRDLDLKKPIYQKTACYGHFGRKEFPWEVPKKLVF